MPKAQFYHSVNSFNPHSHPLRVGCYPDFTDKDIEAREVMQHTLGHTVRKEQSRASHLVVLTPKSFLNHRIALPPCL